MSNQDVEFMEEIRELLHYLSDEDKEALLIQIKERLAAERAAKT